MGVDFRDYDNDGKPDIIVTNLAKQIYALYHNDGNGSFSYRSLAAVSVQRLRGVPVGGFDWKILITMDGRISSSHKATSWITSNKLIASLHYWNARCFC